MKRPYLLGTTAFFAIATAAAATETQTITYDAKGRVVQVSRAGSVNNGANAVYSHDKAHNRIAVTVDGSPPPPPSPPPPNSPPVANADGPVTMQACGTKIVNVTINDTDPDGNLPLSVISATDDGTITASVVSTTSIQLESTTSTGAKTITYTVADSLGATATGILSVTVSGGGSTCFQRGIAGASAPALQPSLAPVPPVLKKGN